MSACCPCRGRKPRPNCCMKSRLASHLLCREEEPLLVAPVLISQHRPAGIKEQKAGKQGRCQHRACTPQA